VTTPNRHPLSGRFTEGPRADENGIVHHPGGGGHTDARLMPGYTPPGERDAQPCQYLPPPDVPGVTADLAGSGMVPEFAQPPS
jgi:hypothetical protein